MLALVRGGEREKEREKWGKAEEIDFFFEK